MAQQRFRLTSTRALAFCGLAMVVIDVVITIWLGSLNPGYSHARQFISELGEAGRPFAWLFAVWSVVYAVLFAAFTVGLWRSLKGQRGARAGTAALFAVAAASAIGGVFPCDAGCAGRTLSAKVHILAGAVSVVGTSLAPFFLARAMAATQLLRDYQVFTLVVGLLLCGLNGWLTLCYFVGLTPSLVGAVQRGLMLVLDVWIVALCMRIGGPERRPT